MKIDLGPFRGKKICVALSGGGDSMALFEEGTKLVNACRKELDTAEQKVVKLSKGPDDAPVEHDFAAED